MANFTTNGVKPSGTSSGSFATIIGAPLGIFHGTNNQVNHDTADNPELQSQVKITPADCAAIGFDTRIDQSQADFNANGNNGTITVNATASGGTALWLRGYEYDGPLTNIPIADPNSPTNASVEFLKLNGSLKFNTLLVGPFDYGDQSNACPLVIPFSLNSSNLENLIFLADTATLSYPLTVQCPPDMTVKCSDPVYYPNISYAGCGSITLAFNPPLPAAGFFAPGTLPLGVTPVTVTATDSEGNTNTCMFNVNVVGTPLVPPALPPLTGQTSVQVPMPYPYAEEICGLNTNKVPGTTTNALSYNTQGTFTIYWTFDDGEGDTLTTNQTVIVHSTASPVPPPIPAAVGECSVTVSNPPVAFDPLGNVTGMTTAPLTYTTQGTNYITWTFTDANGNTTNAIQQVIVHDDQPPVKPTLPNLTFNICTGASAVATPPTTTDYCGNPVTGSTSTIFPITTPGTNVVTWTFTDGNGNTTTANQNIIVTGLTFQGFNPPVGAGGTCSKPLTTANTGNTLPIKFDMFCGTNQITTGTPPIVQIQAYKNCIPGADVVTEPAAYQNDWHYNWQTAGFAKGVYQVIVTLPDGTSQYFFVTLK